MPELQPSDVVRIDHLAIPTRDVDGPSANPPQPRVGELGVVISALGDDLYLVEHSTDDGRALWIAEFHAGELELISHGAD